jgi:ADP-ribosylglycohydrolase
MGFSLERFGGALIGLAVGDALGTTLEFSRRDSRPAVTDIVGGGPFGLEPGQWTDDTSMAMCLAESLVQTGDFDPVDQMRRYVKWFRDGYWSSNGRCFDIGGTVAGALSRFERTGEPFSGSSDPHKAGNGSLMRLAPVPLRYAADPARAVHLAGESSRTTHAASEAVDACRYFAALLVGALQGLSKDTLLTPGFAPEGVSWDARPLCAGVAAIASGQYTAKKRDHIHASGYVLHTLEAALWCFARTDTFEEGALLAINLAEDADTTGAVYGQLAGAFFGYAAIRDSWRERIARRDDILGLSRRLVDAAGRDSSAELR